jgi:alpha-tubulin suppressor-like RCC1 family protein
MTTGFLTYNGESRLVDVDDLLVRREFFSDGRLWTWGLGTSGQLGTNNSSNRSSPVTTVAGGTNWKQVAAGATHMAAIKTDGTLWTWGRGLEGQLGDNTSSSRSSPVTTTGGGTNWKQVACGYRHTAAIKTDGTVWCWGRGDFGQLGQNAVSSRSSPVSTLGGQGNWKQVSCGDFHTAAIKTDGTLWTWGRGTDGQLGAGNSSNRSSPVTTSGGGTNWKQVACGYRHTAAVKTDGTLWTWGFNGFGALGDNTVTVRSSPVTTITGSTNWKQVACGDAHTAAIKTDGTLWTWGYNATGCLGNNTSSSTSSPVTTVAGGTNWKQVSVGYRTTAAIKTDGTLWTWGGNNQGGLGDNTTTSRSSPITTVAGGINWKQVAVGTFTTAAVTDLSLGSL